MKTTLETVNTFEGVCVNNVKLDISNGKKNVQILILIKATNIFNFALIISWFSNTSAKQNLVN
jgi:hypothetical protein